MHAKYGPIVRVTPAELHVNDPAFLPELMPLGKHPRDKYPRLIQLFGFSQAAGATADHHLHRTRRAAISKMFSKEAVRRLEPTMRKTWEKLLVRLREFQQTGEEIHLLPMFGAFTNDTITEYAYGFNLNWTQAPQFNRAFFEMVSNWQILGHCSSVTERIQARWISQLWPFGGAVFLVYATRFPASQMASTKNQSWLRNLRQIQIGDFSQSQFVILG